MHITARQLESRQTMLKIVPYRIEANTHNHIYVIYYW